MTKAKNVEDYIARQRAGIAQNPECGNSHYNLAVGLMGQKKYDEAEKELFEALECSPSLAEAYVLLGGICLQRRNLDGCLKYNKMAVKARPGFSEGYGNIGFVELQRGNLDEAIKNLERATAFNFRYVQAFANCFNQTLRRPTTISPSPILKKGIFIGPLNTVIKPSNWAMKSLRIYCQKLKSTENRMPVKLPRTNRNRKGSGFKVQRSKLN
jgi:tetratricopeptide (TPR) repeat protein